MHARQRTSWGGGLDEKVLKARAFFEKNYSLELKTRVEIDEPLQAYLSSLDLVPDWEYAAFSENEEESYLEMPLLSIPKIGFGPPEAEEDEILLSDQRLVVREIKETGEMYLYTSLWIPADTPSLIAMPSLTMFDKGQFTGVVYFFTLDGLFYWGAGFQDGEALTSEFIVSEEEIAPSTRSTLINSKPGFFCTPVYQYAYTCDCGNNTNTDAPLEGCDCILKDVIITGYSCTGGGSDSGSGGGGTPPPPSGGGGGPTPSTDEDDDETEEEQTFTVTVSASPSAGGRVSGGGSYENGTQRSISATARQGFKFVGWSGDSNSTSSAITITVTKDMSFTAMFEEITYDEEDEPTDPCESMKNKMADSLFVAMLEQLFGLTSSNYEAGRSYTYSYGDYTFTNHNGAAGAPEIDWVPSSSSPIDGFIHSHMSDGLPIFSPIDLLVPGSWNSRGGINDLSRFSLGVVTSGGTYFLQITNMAAYQTFFDTYSTNLGKMILESSYFGYMGESSGDAIKGLLKLLKERNSGMTLMKKHGNVFRKVNVSSNDIVSEITCF